MRYLIEALLIASAFLGGYIYASQPDHAEKVIVSKLQDAQALSNRLSGVTTQRSFLDELEAASAKPAYKGGK